MREITILKKKGETINIIIKEENDILDVPSRVITDNDFAKDSPEVFLTLKLAHENKLDLLANIQTFNPDPNWSPERVNPQWQYVYQAASGMNVPPLTKGSQRKMIAPAGGKIEDTVRVNSAGADLIIKEALAGDLVIFVGGQCTTVADAYLKNPAIADKITIFHTNGFYYPYEGKAQGYNTQDHWAAYICAKRMRYVNCNFKGVPAYWYENKDLGLIQQAVTLLPNNPMSLLFKKWYAENYGREKLADSVPVLWFLNRSLWTSTEQRKLDNDTTFTFVNGHNWNQYGPTLLTQFT